MGGQYGWIGLDLVGCGIGGWVEGGGMTMGMEGWLGGEGDEPPAVSFRNRRVDSEKARACAGVATRRTAAALVEALMMKDMTVV